MQSVRITAPFQNTPRLLIHDLHLVVHDHIFHIFLKHGVGLEQLVDGMYALRLNRIALHQLLFLLELFFIT